LSAACFAVCCLLSTVCCLLAMLVSLGLLEQVLFSSFLLYYFLNAGLRCFRFVFKVYVSRIKSG
jgi:hypothetical protein